jgi:hypothetical protein
MSVPADHEGIQEALDASMDGDVICVEPGWYVVEDLDFLGKAVTLVGVEGRESTIIDGGGVGPVVRFSTGEGTDTVLYGFTVTGGVAGQGGCLFIVDSSPTLEELVVTGCTATGDHWEVSGGGIFITGSGASPTLVEVEVTDCRVEQGWGGGIAISTAAATMTNVSVSSCAAVDGGYDGGGIYLEGAQVAFTGLSLVGNQTESGSGAGLAANNSDLGFYDLEVADNSSSDGAAGLWFSHSTVRVERARFDGNWAYCGSGGGIAADETIFSGEDLEFSGNMCWEGDGGALYARSSDLQLSNLSALGNGGGGGVAVLDSNIDISGLDLRGNGAVSGCGGGLRLGGVSGSIQQLRVSDNECGIGGGMCLWGLSDLEFQHVMIDQNEVSSNPTVLGAGLAIDLDEGSSIRFEDALILANTATAIDTYGAGLWVSGSGAEVTLNSVTIHGNVSEGTGHGTGLAVERGALVTLDGVSITGGVSGTGVYLEDESTVQASYSNVQGNDGGDFEGMESFVGQDGNLSVAPEFLDTSAEDPLEWDLHLASSSPLIDAGPISSQDPDGSRADMGAYGGESAGGWDLDGDGYPAWWQPGPYDATSYPAEGWDCDDLDAEVYPGQGC